MGLLRSQKKDWIHLIYFLSNTPCNFCKKKKDHRGRWAHSAGKKGLNSPRLCLTLMRHTIFVKKQVIGGDGLAALKKRIGFISLPFKLTCHASFAKKLGVVSLRTQKSYLKTGHREVQVQCACKKNEFTLCTFNSHASSNFINKGHMDGWARCAHKKLFVSPHFVWLLNAMQF